MGLTICRYFRALSCGLLLLFGLANSACTTTRFLAQAAAGQWELYAKARPIDEVIADPNTEPRVRSLLEEVLRIKAYGRAHGLRMDANYEEYVQLDRPYVVWFVNASEPLAFVPKTFTFPIVGSFPGLSWFAEEDALEFAAELREEGWDVNVRGVGAYSTGGWFDDPVLSSMFAEHPASVGFLVNVVLHESVHATTLVENQQFFNESIASFIADQMTPVYLIERYGASSTELREYLLAREQGDQRIALLGQAYEALDALYLSALADDEKYRRKAHILAELSQRIPFESPPNNATLIGFRLYHEGEEELRRLRQVCGTLPRLLAALSSLRGEHFDEEQSPQIGLVFEQLVKRGCAPFPPQPAELWNPQLRERRRRDAFRDASRSAIR